MSNKMWFTGVISMWQPPWGNLIHVKENLFYLANDMTGDMQFVALGINHFKGKILRAPTIPLFILYIKYVF